MRADVDTVLQLLNETRINREIKALHDEARETYKLHSMSVDDAQEFKFIVQSYYQHHMRHIGEGNRSEVGAFGEVRHLLESLYRTDQWQDGYVVALQAARSESGLRGILEKIAETLKERHVQQYVDHVFHEYIDPSSQEDAIIFAEALKREFGPLIEKHGGSVKGKVFAWNPRAALEYWRQAIRTIMSVARKS